LSGVSACAEGGHVALFFVQRMFIDAKDLRAVQAEALGGFADGKLRIDALDGGVAEAFTSGQFADRNARLVALVEHLTQGRPSDSAVISTSRWFFIPITRYPLSPIRSTTEDILAFRPQSPAFEAEPYPAKA